LVVVSIVLFGQLEVANVFPLGGRLVIPLKSIFQGFSELLKSLLLGLAEFLEQDRILLKVKVLVVAKAIVKPRNSFSVHLFSVIVVEGKPVKRLCDDGKGRSQSPRKPGQKH